MEIDQRSEVFKVVAGALSLASPVHPVPRYVNPRSMVQVTVPGTKGVNYRLLVTQINARLPTMPPITQEEAQACETVADLCQLVAARKSGNSRVANTLSPRQTFACSVLVGQMRDFTPDAIRGFGEYLATHDADRAMVLEKLRKLMDSIAGHAPESTVLTPVLPFRNKTGD